MAWPGEENMVMEPVASKPSFLRMMKTMFNWCRRRSSSLILGMFCVSAILYSYDIYRTSQNAGFSLKYAATFTFDNQDPAPQRVKLLEEALEELLSQPYTFDDTLDPLQADPELRQGLVHLLTEIPQVKVEKDTPIPSSMSADGMVYFLLPEGKDIKTITVDSELQGVFPRQNTRVIANMQQDDSPDLARLWSIRMDATYDSPMCTWYNKQNQGHKIIVPNVWKSVNVYNNEDVTLVTQLDGGRVRFLQKILTNWDGALSATIYLKRHMAQNFSKVVQEIAPLLLTRQNVDLHLVLQTNILYPVNFLRALALNNSHTDYVFLSDADLIPSINSHKQIKEWISAGVVKKNRVFVVAAFEALEEIPYPVNKTSLNQVWDSGVVIQFFSQTFIEGHAPTNYRRWRNYKEPYMVEYNDRYEPYIVIKRSEVPPYNENFVGYFKNKIIHLMELHLRGFQFWVFPDVFTIHYPHAKDTDISFKWATRSCVWHMADLWIEELKNRITNSAQNNDQQNR